MSLVLGLLYTVSHTGWQDVTIQELIKQLWQNCALVPFYKNCVEVKENTNKKQQRNKKQNNNNKNADIEKHTRSKNLGRMPCDIL